MCVKVAAVFNEFTPDSDLMKLYFYTPVYALTLLLSAALLFSVQPLFSRMILPLLGGTPQVWNTAMLFFQLMLLAGYAYAHGTSKFMPVRIQALVHLILLFLFMGALPFSIPDGWTPPTDQNPTLWQLSLMTLTIGGPFFILAGSAPMLQRWFSNTDHPDAHNPYFLYGASNLGSMTALLAYPFIIEPLMTLKMQSTVWAAGYGGLIALTLLSTFLVWTGGKTNNNIKQAANDDTLYWKQRAQWLVLAFIPSSLMLGVTAFITTDIASVPLLWILPLSLYVGTFIIVFSRNPILSRKQAMAWHEVSLILLLGQLVCYSLKHLDPMLLTGLHLSVFFFSALVCHMELARSRPSAKHITEFYMIMALGGALGGFFNAIMAPYIFTTTLEYPLVLAAVCFMRFATNPDQSFSNWVCSIKVSVRERGLDGFFSVHAIVGIFTALLALFFFALPAPQAALYVAAVTIGGGLLFLQRRRWAFALLASLVILLFPPGFQWTSRGSDQVILQERNFFGTLKIMDTNDSIRILLHGTTTHGAQSLDPAHRLDPLAYYSQKSPIGDAFEAMAPIKTPQEVAVLGLGVGVSACYAHKDRHFDFYEINPSVVHIAENPEFFTYLSDCGSPYNVILGDARLTIQKKPDERYDLIVVDAFSSDNIPVHLLTKEAIEIYLRKLKKDGILLFHISNNYLDLEPVLSEAAVALNIQGYGRFTESGKIEGTNIAYYPAQYFAMTHSENYAQFLKDHGWTPGKFRKGVRLWTDQYSNIFSVLGAKTAKARFKALKEQQKQEK